MKAEKRSPEAVNAQFSHFETGFPFARIVKPATKDDGICVLSDENLFSLLENLPNLLDNKKIAKFVPASGAASRMFKELYAYLENDDDETTEKAHNFLKKLHLLACFDDLTLAMKKDGFDIEENIKNGNYKLIISYLLTEKGLNYGNLPKALLKFHRYDDECRTALEEHLVEAALYAQNNDGVCPLHFTISPNHQQAFKTLVNAVVPKYEARFGVKYDITFSVQNPSTDTLAAEMDNQPFHDNNGKLLFRPGGHGALLENLNQLNYDIILVKNIDNVTTESKNQPTIIYKKALAAHLLELKAQVDFYLQQIENQQVSDELVEEIVNFGKTKLNISDLNRENLFAKLNRPMRVCGMVKNEGEPGGGPFWTVSSNGETALQIVESSQINHSDAAAMAAVARATHFNPVDMACAIKDYKGNRFRLADFVDPETGFISAKSYGDRQLKAMELPGLWNGAMAHWITIFVEVPLATFNPVKNVFDLLKR